MALPISNKTRARKNEPYTEQGAIERWVDEIAESTGRSKEDVVRLAIVKLEIERTL